jgi:excinuclease ABC subunit C
VLQFVRDETHRFATGLNQRLRSKDLYFPILESIEGIGPKRAAAIMKAYENIASIAAADPAEIAGRCNISETAAKAVRAAAALTLEDSKNKVSLRQKSRYGKGSAAALAAEAAGESFAAEDTPEYDDG